MTTMQNNIVAYLNDYICFVGHKAHMYELDGMQARSDRLKEKLADINTTIADYKYDCQLNSSK
jgi:hypothetical protein